MKPALYKSLALHTAVFLLLVVDLPLFWREDMIVSQAPIIVDLEQVKISEMTNLPAKAKVANETKAASSVKKTPPKPEPKPQPQKTEQPSVVEDSQGEEPQEMPLPPKQDFIVPPQPSKPKLPDKKPEPKRPTPAKPAVKPESKKTKPKKPEKQKAAQVSALKNLLDSVSALEKSIGSDERQPTIDQATQTAHTGIEGGRVGSYFSELSISETDAIAARLRQCWNLDPGAMGIEGMIIEIRAYLNRDGSVQKVDILDTLRYNRDRHFRSVADSAKRAVYICQPYGILSKKYGDKYEMWKTMLLRFDPINHTVN